jgi:hypothetical protein
MGLTFEQVWATIQASKEEHDRMIAELDKKFQETDRKFQETDRKFQETERLIKEQSKETDKKIEKLSEIVGGVTGSLGDMAEGLMASDLRAKFAALGLKFEFTIKNFEVTDKETGRDLAEVDILLINGTIAMVVEAKTTMTRGDVDKHEKRMEILRRASHPLLGNRKLYGAMAGVKTSSPARKHAIAKGFYVIALTGSTIQIDVPEGFKPKTW